MANNDNEKLVKELEEKLAQAQQEAAEAKQQAADAKQQAADAESKLAAAEEEKKKAETAKPKMVTIRLHQDRNLKDDVTVIVNRRQYVIQRGVDVKVPRAVAEVLANKERMLKTIAAFDEKHANKG